MYFGLFYHLMKEFLSEMLTVNLAKLTVKRRFSRHPFYHQVKGWPALNAFVWDKSDFVIAIAHSMLPGQLKVRLGH